MHGSSYRRPGSVFAAAPLPTRAAPTTPSRMPPASDDPPPFPFVHTCGEGFFPERRQRLTARRPHAYPHDHPGCVCSTVICQQTNRRRGDMCYAVTTTLTETVAFFNASVCRRQEKNAKREKHRTTDVHDCSQHDVWRTASCASWLFRRTAAVGFSPAHARTRDRIRTFTDARGGGQTASARAVGGGDA
jgi:hypothetical protein